MKRIEIEVKLTAVNNDWNIASVNRVIPQIMDNDS